jgi:predicted lipoprotein with Yx(FWY)xxD motif
VTTVRLFRAFAVVLTAVAGAAVAGCGGGGTAITTPFVTTHHTLEHGPAYEVKVGNIDGLGPVLVDGQGLTLYMFESDQRGSPSHCYNICEVQWPPLILPSGVSRPLAGPGIHAGLLASSPRRDGTTQITYNGWPLYLWPQDRAPGEATGQALTNGGGRWYVVEVSGDPLKTS